MEEMTMQRWWIGPVMVLALHTVACAEVDDIAPEGELGTARQAQLDDGTGKWRNYTFDFSNGVNFAHVLVIGDAAVGNYAAATEYWYANVSSLQYLGTKNLSISYVDGSGTPPSNSGSQVFTLPRDPTWTSFTSDPLSGGSRYDNGNVHLRAFHNANGITEIAWYQTTSGSPANMTPNGTFSVGSGSVTVPSGQTGYHVDQSVP